MPVHLLLRCKDANQTRDFYEAVLGFDVKISAEGTCTVTKEDCTLIFTEDDLWANAPIMTGTVYCFISDVYAYYEGLKDIANLAWHLERMSYGIVEFGVVDCNGYPLAFAQTESNKSSIPDVARPPA